jgi:hypothetical protein
LIAERPKASIERSKTMLVDLDLPKAFSLRDENEFFPVQHLLARMNPGLIVAQVATGTHINGGCTVFWGLAYMKDQPPGEDEVNAALKEAGFDFEHGSIQSLDVVPPHTGRQTAPAEGAAVR